ncbi:MAG: RNA methyltransferase [Cyanobacteria bacterium SIG28]|nr:RNA methyltransferase [Cyanobacteria bacterium SIG28]
MKITSVNNELVKETAKLLKNKYREEAGCFLIEGEKGINEAIQAGLVLRYIFTEENTNSYSGNNVIETTEAVLSKISDAKSAPKVVAVAEQLKYSAEDLRNAKKVLLLEGIKDAGNLGTILRTSVAFGVDGIVLYGNTVDLYNPKCVRSAVGNLWKIPVISINNLVELEELFCGFERVATLPKGENVVNLKDYVAPEKVLIMFGSEADGLSDELKTFATKNVTIEMDPTVESLNLSVSVAVLVYTILK